MPSSGFEGQWDTDYGPLVLTVNGSTVNGTFGSYGGTVEGIVCGNLIRGKWKQRAVGGNGITWGDFVITLTGVGGNFTGTWTYQDDLAGEGGTWSGSRNLFAGSGDAA
ncbi:MAG TPA: hypothetical protein VGJ05_20390 [Fimbriiglobus sp.]|jgi:hypothetical protein